MGFAFNPLTGNFDLKGSGGGGGASYIDGEVQNFSALPQTVGTPPVDSAYLVREAEGTWLINRKPAGIYIRTANTGTRASDWTHAGAFPDVFNDANFILYDNADSTKNLAFQLSGITTGTTRTLTVPNSSGTISLEGHTHAAADVTSGVFDNARINFAAPAAIGSTTAAAGTFTTLNSTSLVVTNTNTFTFNANDSFAATAYASLDSVRLLFKTGGAARAGVSGGGDLFVLNNLSVGGSVGSGALLAADGVNILAQRNAANSQEARLYSTFTSSTNYQRMTIKSVRQTLSALSGASATTTGTFIPDGAVVVGVTTRVSTLLTGATGYTIGDGTDADRWGDITGTAVGTTSDNRDWTAATIECFTAGGNITLTAKGSNFTAGAIEISVFYLAGEAD